MQHKAIDVTEQSPMASQHRTISDAYEMIRELKLQLYKQGSYKFLIFLYNQMFMNLLFKVATLVKTNRTLFSSYQVPDSLLQFPVLSLTVVELQEEAVDHLAQVAVGDLELLDDDLKDALSKPFLSVPSGGGGS